ncbi:hypothetical protein TURU_091935 [Turdus rufiventris]|nr:hypothetical protein TURU_091935 [Turdus rufiventris]
MAPRRRLAYKADFKLKAINHAKEHGNRSAAGEFNINESMVRKMTLRVPKRMTLMMKIRVDTGSGLLDAAIAQLMISDMEDEEFEDFMADE